MGPTDRSSPVRPTDQRGVRVRRAVVLGGSVAGLLAARVLSDHADEVVVLEPDDLAEHGTGRGAPQRDQLHAVLAMGHVQLERWLPGITAELIGGGAHLGEGPEAVGSARSWTQPGSCRPPPIWPSRM